MEIVFSGLIKLYDFVLCSRELKKKIWKLQDFIFQRFLNMLKYIWQENKYQWWFFDMKLELLDD